jgi:hypothetical protein
MGIRIAAGLLAVAALAPAADQVYQAPSPEPTPEETLILEFINRCRADPNADALRIAPPGAEPRIPSSTAVDFAMFRTEMAAIKAQPPLVFDLRLLDAARKHSHYMVLHGLGHDEDPGKPGFTGRSPSDRAKAAGWRGGASGENCYRDAGDAWASHIGFIIDWGPGGPGGMQPERGHRRNITSGSYSVVGAGAVPHSGRLSVTHLFGGDGRRYAGGVVYVDKDRDAWYGLGEGRGGVEVQVGDTAIATWGSGAYAVAIPSGATSLTMRAGGVTITRPIPAGPGNVKIDWIIPQEQDLAAADKLLAAVDAAKDPASAAARKARVALLIGAERLALDDVRAARVRELTAELGGALEADRAAVRAALADAKEFRRVHSERAKAWNGTAAEAWFDEAALFVRVTAGWAATPEDATPTRLRALAKELRAVAAKAQSAEFRPRFDALAGEAEARAGAPAGAAGSRGR